MSRSRAELLTDLDSLLADPTVEPDATRVIDLLEDLISAREPLDALVNRYALSPSPAPRCLSFVLARHASRGPDRSEVVAPLWRLVERSAHHDETTLINVLTTIQLLAAYRLLTPMDARRRRLLAALLMDSLRAAPSVQATVVPLIGVLHAHGLLADLPPETIDDLRGALAELMDSDDDLVRMEMTSVADFLR